MVCATQVQRHRVRFAPPSALIRSRGRRNALDARKSDVFATRCSACGHERAATDMTPRHRCPQCGKAYLSTRYEPNRISPEQRIAYGALALGLIGYGAWGLANDVLYVPGKRHIHALHGVTLWIMLAAMLCAAAVAVSIVVDHYDRRDNERVYKAIVEYGFKAALLLYLLSPIYSLIEAIVTDPR